MKKIIFYKTDAGNSPVEKSLDELTDNQVKKITWVLRLLRENDNISSKYLKQLKNTDDIWEVRVKCWKK